MSCDRRHALQNTITTSAEYTAAHCSVDSIRTFAGASSGIASSIVTCPLDVVRTNLQAQGAFQHKSVSSRVPFTNRGFIGVVRAVWLEKGPQGMYQGLGPTILAYFPRWAIFFGTYHRSNELYRLHLDLKSHWVASLMSSLTAGTLSIVATNPIQVIKIRLMSQNSMSNRLSVLPKWQYNSAFDAARQIYHSEGISAFYSGLTPGLLGISHLAIQFPLYEKLKMELTGSGLGERSEKSRNHISGVLAAGALSKMVSTSLTYPHELVRTRLQTQQVLKCTVSESRRYSGIIKTGHSIWVEEGWQAFYAGLGTSLIRAVPASMTTMLVYESMLSLLIGLKTEGERKLGS